MGSCCARRLWGAWTYSPEVARHTKSRDLFSATLFTMHYLPKHTVPRGLMIKEISRSHMASAMILVLRFHIPLIYR